MRNLIKKLYNIGLPLFLAGCTATSTPVVYQPTPITERKETPVIEVTSAPIYTPILTPVYSPIQSTVSAYTPTPTQTEVPLMQPSPQVSYKKLEDFMNEYGTYFLTSYIILPQQAEEIVRWSEEVMHLDQIDRYYSCMLHPENLPNWNWVEARDCINTIDNLLEELKNKIGEVGGYDWFNYNKSSLFTFEVLHNKLSDLNQLAEYEDTAKYAQAVRETNHAMNELYINFIISFPENVSGVVPQPAVHDIFIPGPTHYYMFTNGQEISPFENMYSDSSKVFGSFFVDEHNYAKRIFIFGYMPSQYSVSAPAFSVAELVGIFEYSTLTEAQNALNRLHGSINVSDKKFIIDNNEYQTIYWKVPEYNTNQYALFINLDRFLIVADPDSQIKDNNNLVVRNRLTPLLE